MLNLYNTLGRKKEPFKPINANLVGIYTCGPTVYGPDHIGHIKTWIFFDWLKRYLISEGYQVKLVQNITDVGHMVGDGEAGEDKIEKQAKSESKTPQEIAAYYIQEHINDLKSLNFLIPDEMPKATDHIDDIIEYIKVLIEKGFAYEVEGNVYFNVTKDKEYGKLSNRTLDQLMEGTRVEADKLKHNQADFALWLSGGNHLKQWESPWGKGYPGWHIECSVMSQKYLGQPFDIHGSGIEHVFPHHENEIAQSESYAAKPMANYWLHTGLLNIDGQKMSKSKSNYITVKDAVKLYDVDTIRIALMMSHWRKPMDWTPEVLQEAQILAKKLVRNRLSAPEGNSGIIEQIKTALEDDFNTPKAMTVIFENTEKLTKEDYDYICSVFGLKLINQEVSKSQKVLISERENLRKQGKYREADEIRKKLEEEGIMIEDTSEGTRILK